MIQQILTCEKEYKNQFSEYTDFEDYIEYKDYELPDMHSHNCFLIKNKKNAEEMAEIINGMIDERMKAGKTFLQIEMDFPLKDEFYSKLSKKPKISTYYYMGQEVKNIINPIGNKDCLVKIATDLKVLNDGVFVDIEANKENMGKIFAKKRVERKKEVYEDPTSDLNLYVCYHKEKAIGNCELFTFDDISKIEDFDILKPYQRKGFGTSLLNFVMDEAIVAGSEYIYLVTDTSNTVVKMYEKFGLEVLLKKTELFFSLK